MTPASGPKGTLKPATSIVIHTNGWSLVIILGMGVARALRSPRPRHGKANGVINERNDMETIEAKVEDVAKYHEWFIGLYRLENGTSWTTYTMGRDKIEVEAQLGFVLGGVADRKIVRVILPTGLQ